jgi:glycosyltransferase involved in cell wall biosynthesis
VTARQAFARPRVTFLSQAPTPYLTPILNALSERVDLDVLFFRRPGGGTRRNEAWSEFRDPWGEPPRFTCRFANSLLLHEPRTDFHVQVAFGAAWRTLSRSQPDVVIVHGWGPLVIEPLAWATAHGRGRVLWTESHAESGLIRTTVSDKLRRAILLRADAVVSNGTLATAYAERLGVEPGRIITSCLPSRPTSLGGARDAEGPALDSITFLFVGRLVPRKRAGVALEAFRKLAERRRDVRLVIVGSGPEEASLRERARPLGDRVVFAGRLEQSRLRDAYMAADILLVPSEREVWGLVVNEALAAGLFVVASRKVGSAPDLIDAQSGAIVSGSQADWDRAVAAAAEVDRSGPARDARRARVDGCTPERFADDFHLAAVRSVAVRRRGRP